LGLLLGGLLILVSACTNPFAPAESGLSEELWEEQRTVGGLLRNFRTSYTFRDSLRYADLIAEDFVFQFFNPEMGRDEQWYRDTELRATGGLMRNVSRLDLRWGTIPAEIDTFSSPDSTAEFTLAFTLSAGEITAISGFARFRARAGEDGRFRLTRWVDDF
jgi:hypothetical protein